VFVSFPALLHPPIFSLSTRGLRGLPVCRISGETPGRNFFLSSAAMANTSVQLMRHSSKKLSTYSYRRLHCKLPHRRQHKPLNEFVRILFPADLNCPLKKRAARKGPLTKPTNRNHCCRTKGMVFRSPFSPPQTR
jgi:hypothetical protein